MKKLLLAIAIASTSLLSFTSCTKEYITNSLPGVTYSISVPSEDWKVFNANTYLLELDFPELDQRYFDDGTVTLAIKTASANTLYELIPAEIGNYKYSANYEVGSIGIYAKRVSGSVAFPKPENATIKVTLTDADFGGN